MKRRIDRQYYSAGQDSQSFSVRQAGRRTKMQGRRDRQNENPLGEERQEEIRPEQERQTERRTDL